MDIIETNSAAKIAWKKDVIPKSGIISANPSNTAPLMIGMINPSETIANGRVNINMMGFTNIFINVNNTVVMTRASKLLNENPSNNALVIQRETPVAVRFVRFVIILEDILKIPSESLLGVVSLVSNYRRYFYYNYKLPFVL